MKLVNPFIKLMVILLALPVVMLLLFEGVFLIFTDKIPGVLRKLSLYPSRMNN